MSLHGLNPFCWVHFIQPHLCCSWYLFEFTGNNSTLLVFPHKRYTLDFTKKKILACVRYNIFFLKYAELRIVTMLILTDTIRNMLHNFAPYCSHYISQVPQLELESTLLRSHCISTILQLGSEENPNAAIAFPPYSSQQRAPYCAAIAFPLYSSQSQRAPYSVIKGKM